MQRNTVDGSLEGKAERTKLKIEKKKYLLTYYTYATFYKQHIFEKIQIIKFPINYFRANMSMLNNRI
jgi:hypothetical protein